MGSKTVSLEASAYERLKAAKTPGESFSEAINRILAPSRPTYRQLSGFLTPSEAKSLKVAVRRMRSGERPAEEKRMKSWRRDGGGRSRH